MRGNEGYLYLKVGWKDLPIVKWYFGLKFRNLRGGVVFQSKSERGSMWYGSIQGSFLSSGKGGADYGGRRLTTLLANAVESIF
jgi:hypothetical protein